MAKSFPSTIHPETTTNTTRGGTLPRPIEPLLRDVSRGPQRSGLAGWFPRSGPSLYQIPLILPARTASGDRGGLQPQKEE
jgi:hypothetical protein